MSAYVPGDRVWVYMEGDGWWPARVLSDADVGSRTPGQDVAVLFYGGIDTPASLYELNSHSEAANICFFETSSSKAVTTNPELEAAIRHASEDAEANPLKTASVIAASAAGLSTAAGANAAPTAAVSRATAKRVREMDQDDDDEVGLRAGHSSGGSASLPGTHHLRPEELQRLAEKITAAAEAQNVAKVRAALCSLDGVDVFLTELEETKIGIAVGSVLNYPALKPLWPLARAIISFWARQLPAETLAAIRSVKQHEAPSSTLKEAVEPASPTSPASPLSPLRRQAASPSTAGGTNAGSSAFDNLGSPSTTTDGASQQPQQRKSFFHHVRQLLDNPDDLTRVDDDVVENVARRIVAEITDRDDRQMLLIRLREPDMDFLRTKLLSGEWTPRKYLEQPAEVFLTEHQKAEDALRIKKKMEAVDAAANAGLNRTELFKCERCGKRDCTFYELQVRGADEPTTKYVTCLNCKHAWSQE